MILEADLGNSRIKWRLREAETLLAKGVAEGLNSFLAEASAQVRSQERPLRRFFCVSVRSSQTNDELREKSCEHWGLNPEFAQSQAFCAGVENGYQSPESLGADRWMAVVAAFSRLNRACVVVDAGSALTVDLISYRGRHLGGYIGPGLNMMRRSLNTTAGIHLAGETGGWDCAPGRATQTAVASAIGAMISGLIDEATRQLEVSEGLAPELVLTGGDASWLKTRYPAAHHWPDLVLDGLALAMADYRTN